MKLELGKRYVTRNRRVTGPMMRNRTAPEGSPYRFKARLGSGWASWTETGAYLHNGTDAAFDIVREYKEPKKRPAVSLKERAARYAARHDGASVGDIAGARSVKK